jgi:hypothetical protein
MQAIFESVFDIGYLAVMLVLGLIILRRAARLRAASGATVGEAMETRAKIFLLFGAMTLVLACGDAFHLIPRVWALNTTGIGDYTAALGFGTLVTSITMTIFYVMFYHVWMMLYDIHPNAARAAVIYVLAVVRIVLCLFPQNKWFSTDAPESWDIYRNIPFVIIGIIMIYLLYREQRRKPAAHMKWMWLAVTLSFLFYIPVVLFAKTIPLTGMFMLPKTVCYVWMVCMVFAGTRDI